MIGFVGLRIEKKKVIDIREELKWIKKRAFDFGTIQSQERESSI